MALDTWRYADLAAELGLSVHTLKKRMKDLHTQGFPQPLPYSRRTKRWRADAVRAWMERRERAAGASAPSFAVLDGGRR